MRSKLIWKPFSPVVCRRKPLNQIEVASSACVAAEATLTVIRLSITVVTRPDNVPAIPMLFIHASHSHAEKVSLRRNTVRGSERTYVFSS